MGTCGSFFTLLQLFVSAIMMASVLFFCYYANPNSLIFFVISSYGHSTVLDHSFWVIWLGLSFPILALFFLFILKQGVFFRLFRPVFMTGLQSLFDKQWSWRTAFGSSFKIAATITLLNAIYYILYHKWSLQMFHRFQLWATFFKTVFARTSNSVGNCFILIICFSI